MPTNQIRNLAANPFVLWGRLAMKSWEMIMNSTQVVGHRMSRMALAGPSPSQRDRREFAIMGREKGEAAMESVQAAALQMQAQGQQFATHAFRQMLSTSTAMMSIFASRTPAQSVGRQSQFMRDSINDSVATAVKLSGSTARIARRALNPVHKRVSKNVKRLRKG